MNLNIAFYGPWVPLGKKSSETDVLLASHSSSEGVFSFAAPSMYPEKIHSLIMPAMMSNAAVVHYTPALQGSTLGETIVLLDLLGKPGFFAVSEDADLGTLDAITKTTSLSQWARVPDDEVSIREEIKNFPISPPDGPTKVIVDASFDVKSVGTVVLGLVQSGSLNVYDKLTAYPSGKEATVKSIQKQDKNFKTAEPNDRVGLSMKGVSVEDVPRGTLLSAEPIPSAKEFEAKVTLSPFAKELPHDLHLCLGLQWGGVHLDGNKITSEKEWALDGTGIIAHNAKPGGLRVLGRVDLL
ncbi:EF-Tu/IF-2/RF-3 family GTPase [archaeon]